jgi:adenylate cyclase
MGQVGTHSRTHGAQICAKVPELVNGSRNLTDEFTDAGLLDGLGEREREARLTLLRELVEEGFSLEDLKRAAAEDRLGLLPVDRVLTDEPKYTAEEIAKLVDAPLDFLLSVRQAMGLALPAPDERIFGDEDLEAARIFAQLRATGLPEDALLEVTRVLGSGLSQGAEAIRMLVARWLLPQGVDEYELSLRSVQAARELLPVTTPLLQYTLKAHMRDQIRNQQFGGLELSEGMSPSMRQVYVGFSDMVAFTRLGELIDIDELGEVLGGLNDEARAAVQPPARIVKTIGDAVMFVSPAPAALVETALALTERVDRAGLPEIRSGLAAGVALSREGDWYGPPVNLASRVTGVAHPGSVLATAEMRDAAQESYAWSRAGEFDLKGFKRRVPLYRVRRGEPS